MEKKHFVIREVTVGSASLNEGDTFILDCGLTVYEWIGAEAPASQKFKCSETLTKIRDDREGKPVLSVFDETGGASEAFWTALGGKGPIAPATKDEPPAEFKKAMFAISEKSGDKNCTITPLTSFDKNHLDSNNCYIVDVGEEVYIWVGSKADSNEKALAMSYATQYLVDHNRPKGLPLVVLKEGTPCPGFDAHV